jgi:Ca2+-binding RTX toxin-like protein
VTNTDLIRVRVQGLRPSHRPLAPPNCGFGTCQPTGRTLYLLGDRSSADNTLIGGQAGDYLQAGGGDDVVRGMGGNDSLIHTATSCCGQAGRGSNVLAGGGGDDGISAEDFVSDLIDRGDAPGRPGRQDLSPSRARFV